MTILTNAIKDDKSKARMDLITPQFLTGLGEVLTHGAEKYGSHNWRHGFDFSRVYASLQRHLTAWHSGIDIDAESGLSHLDHAAANIMFLSTYVKEDRFELDDRYDSDLRQSRATTHAIHRGLDDASHGRVTRVSGFATESGDVKDFGTFKKYLKDNDLDNPYYLDDDEAIWGKGCISS